MDNNKIWNDNWKEIAEYGTKSAGNRWAFYLIRKILKNIVLDADSVIMDVGCGMGNKSAELAKLFPDNVVYGIDFSTEGIKFASEYYASMHNLRFVCDDARNVSERNCEKVGLLSSFELLEHIEDWENLLHDFCTISSRYILISTPTGRMREYEIDLGHYRNFKKGELESFMYSHGFRKVDVMYAGFPFWSPITRDLTNRRNLKCKDMGKDIKNELVITTNPIVHNITYFLYRNLSFDRIGDQFMGLFEKK